MTLGEVVIQNPAAAEVFEDLDIDYFCRGTRPLGDALQERNISLDSFATVLARGANSKKQYALEPDWRLVPLRTLLKHIVDTHHAYLRAELPALEKLTADLAARDSFVYPAIGELCRTIQQLRRDVELQMRKEETILFPAIEDLETAGTSRSQPYPSQFGSVANLTRILWQDHQKTSRKLHEIREMTHKYTCMPGDQPANPPLLRKLQDLAANMHRHFHIENNILVPRAIALEKETMHE